MRAMIPLMTVLVAALIGCGTAPLRQDEELADRYHPSGKDEIRGMLAAIDEINAHAPEYYAADFSISGSLADRRYRVLGSVRYGKKERRLYVTFLDYIFRSPVTTFFQEGDDIRIYYPAEKKMYVDSRKTIDLSNYLGIAMDFDLLSGLMAGTVPVIPGHSVRQGLIANDATGSMLILENSRFYETLSFKDNHPDRIKLIDRKTGEPFEIYLEKPVVQGAARFYSRIVIVGGSDRFRLDIHFTGIRMNTPIKVKTHRDLAFPRDLKIIQM